ncbi:hypothetical protein PG985_015177 [Apiospora marii]|uniref:Pyridine nucleotide-disulfide oxidoreductase family protein n=1 Tax=Apiospora marii TaxID=335849 RepID=A0ABR1S678_9PEZI
MANVAGPAGKLQVSRCVCETAHQRYHLPPTTTIAFDHPGPATHVLIPHADLSDEDDDEEDDVDESANGGGGNAVASQPATAPPIGVVTVGGGTDGWPDSLTDDSEDSEDEASETDPVNTTPEQFPEDGTPPSVAPSRLNLTALSQVHNLYFAAYRNQIHISHPRSCVAHSLPSIPDFVLTPPVSDAGRRVVGALDREFSHQVNHLITGMFGEQEILLLAYDDGDVIGYYTKCLQAEVSQREADTETNDQTVRPFFHENVQRSAWGLAIHQKSRAIAVGSNAHAATLFLPALSGQPYDKPLPFVYRGIEPLYKTVVRDTQVVKTGGDVPYSSPQQISSAMSKRNLNWRVVFETGEVGHNIPNLDFSSDKDGHVDKVVAIDVRGNLWLMNIWELWESPQMIPGIHRSRMAPNGILPDQTRPLGWGVVVIPETSFLATANFHDALGISPQKARFAENDKIGRWIDTSRAIHNLANVATTHPWARRTNRVVPHEHQRLVESNCWVERFRDSSHSLKPVDLKPGKNKRRSTVLKDGCSILRTYETDIELRSHEEGGVGIMCQHATVQMNRPNFPLARWGIDRISNVVFVPELSLVVGGSMSGRVALITLTKPQPRSDQLEWLFERGFKIEAILPTQKDEDAGLRPICPLYGVAVGPLPVATGSGDNKARNSLRYRLMIHYYDLRILSYEISRNVETNRLMVA